MAWLITPLQLDKFRKNQKNIIIFDTSWYLPDENKDAEEAFRHEHIMGARFLNLNQFHDTASLLPNMLLRDEALIASMVGSLGVTNEHKIIFYDNSSLHTSCRALWMFKTFGHNPNQLYILDGGLAAWKNEGGKMEEGMSRQTAAKPYSVSFQAHLVRSLVQMKSNLHHPHEQVVDMRHPVRYAGGPEHRSGVRSGHIPGSFSFPYFTLFESDGSWKSVDKIRKQLTGIGVELSYPIVTLCGSGITAAILNFALDLMNHSQHSLYDGSWSEWGASELYPGEESLAERPIRTSLDN